MAAERSRFTETCQIAAELRLGTCFVLETGQMKVEKFAEHTCITALCAQLERQELCGTQKLLQLTEHMHEGQSLQACFGKLTRSGIMGAMSRKDQHLCMAILNQFSVAAQSQKVVVPSIMLQQTNHDVEDRYQPPHVGLMTACP